MDVGFLVKEVKVVFLKPVKEVQGSLVFGGQVMRLNQNLPYVKPKPIIKGGPLAGLTINLEDINSPVRVAQPLYRLVKRQQDPIGGSRAPSQNVVSVRVVVGAVESPHVKVCVDSGIDLGGEFFGEILTRIKNMNLALGSQHFNQSILHLKFTTTTHTVHQTTHTLFLFATLGYLGQSMRITHLREKNQFAPRNIKSKNTKSMSG